MKEVFTFLVGGKAGEGVRKAGLVAGNLFRGRGLRTFQMDDYMSLIRGGHNFSVVSASKDPVLSHYMKADLVVSLDRRSFELHRDHVAEGGVHVFNSDVVEDAAGDGPGVPLTSEAKGYPDPALMLGVGAVAVLSAALGMDEAGLAELIRGEYPRGIEDNVAYGLKVFAVAKGVVGGRFVLDAVVEREAGMRKILYGNEAIALGMAAGGLDVYVAYPMTPASSILHFLAANDREMGLAVVHPENEIAVINMAIGAASVGARAAVGTSGGGFALMEEGLSLAGMTETPVLAVLSARPGPSTGVPTYTEQADLEFALHQGHGDYPRIVASPGSVEEAFYLAAEMLDLVWRFQTPGILLTEKHLSESGMTVDIDASRAAWPEPVLHEGDGYGRYRETGDGISPMRFPPSKELVKWNSYEHDENGITSEDPAVIVRMHDKRERKAAGLVAHMKGMRTVNVFGSEGPTVFTYGSTTMSVLEALRAGGMKAKVVQPVYLRPLPVWELGKHVVDGAVVVEQGRSGQLARLLSEKLGLKEPRPVLRYDGRPFDPEELAASLKEVF